MSKYGINKSFCSIYSFCWNDGYFLCNNDINEIVEFIGGLYIVYRIEKGLKDVSFNVVSIKNISRYFLIVLGRMYFLVF